MTRSTQSSTILANRNFLELARFECQRLRRQAENAVAQVKDDASLNAKLDPESNSIAILVQHIAGNLTSRWTDFLTSDGEKPLRNRDTEFYDPSYATREELFEPWHLGFERMSTTLEELTPEQLTGTIQIRGEAFSVMEAITRSLLHISAHVGQIVLLSKHAAGSNWKTLSIARGESDSARGGYKSR